MKWLSAGAGFSPSRQQLHYFRHLREISWLPLLAVIPGTSMSTHRVPQPSLCPLDGALLCRCSSALLCFTSMAREVSACCTMSHLWSTSLSQRVDFKVLNREVAARRQEKSHPGMKPNDLEIQIKFGCLLFSLEITDICWFAFPVCFNYPLTSKEPTLEWARENWILRERSETRWVTKEG